MAPRKKARKQTGKGVMDVLKAVNQIVRDNKLISRGLGLIPHPLAQGGSWLASQAGYGRVESDVVSAGSAARDVQSAINPDVDSSINSEAVLAACSVVLETAWDQHSVVSEVELAASFAVPFMVVVARQSSKVTAHCLLCFL